MNLPDWIAWPRMDWRWRVMLRWYLLVQAWIALTVAVAWSTRPALENLAILFGVPIVSLWLPLLLVFTASSPRAQRGDGIMRPLLIGVMTVVLWVTQIIVGVLLLVFVIRLALGRY